MELSLNCGAVVFLLWGLLRETIENWCLLQGSTQHDAKTAVSNH